MRETPDNKSQELQPVDWVFQLENRAVDVWCLHLSATPDIASRFGSIVSSEELDHAARFRFDHLRCSYVITRGALRFFLSRYLRTHPTQIALQYGSKGKPKLEATERIAFNISHSAEMALFAFTTDCEIGIDVEQIRPLDDDIFNIARQFFCPEEAAELMPISPKEREQAFFRCWTRKEAYIKAVGDGLSVPLDRFRVTLLPGTPPRFIHINYDRACADAWTLHDINIDSQYAAALAYKAARRTIRLRGPIEPALLASTAITEAIL